MYVLANKIAKTNRTSAKIDTSDAQPNAFVNGRESTALQRALIDSIYQSAPRLGSGVVQRTKWKALKGHSELASMTAKEFEKKLDVVVTEIQKVKRDKGVVLKNTLVAQGLNFLFNERNIGEFINTWNQEGEKDFINVVCFFRLKAALGTATPTEVELAQGELLPTVDTYVTYIGHDNRDRNDLDIGISNFASNKHDGEMLIPQYLTLDLAKKHKTWSENNNRVFITNIKSPYIRICHPEICGELVMNRGEKVGSGEKYGTRVEVNSLLERGYIFVPPCLLLSPDLREEGVDVRRLQRMGVDPKSVVSQGWKVDQKTVPKGVDFSDALPVILILTKYIPMLVPNKANCKVIFSEQLSFLWHNSFIALDLPSSISVNKGGQILKGRIPNQIINMSTVNPIAPITMSGMTTMQCQIWVEDLAGEEYPKPLMLQVCVADTQPSF